MLTGPPWLRPPWPVGLGRAPRAAAAVLCHPSVVRGGRVAPCGGWSQPWFHRPLFVWGVIVIAGLVLCRRCFLLRVPRRRRLDFVVRSLRRSVLHPDRPFFVGSAAWAHSSSTWSSFRSVRSGHENSQDLFAMEQRLARLRPCPPARTAASVPPPVASFVLPGPARAPQPPTLVGAFFFAYGD